MREYVFTVEYEQGIDPVMDVFIEHPETIAKAVSISVTSEGLWRVDRITGSETALDALEDAFLDPTHCNECAGPHPDCRGTREYKTIASDTTSRTIYSHLSQIRNCHSVPYLASKHLGEGLLFDAQRRDHRYEWRFLLPGDRSVGELFDAMRSGVPSEITITLQQTGTPTRWSDDLTTIADLPYKQREVLEAAVSMGYYETPREVKLAEIAAQLNIPTSTCRYRLRRAEAWLTTQFVTENSMLELPSEPVVQAESP
jgi:predicted DNA binding protein